MKLKSLWLLLACSFVIVACDDSGDGNDDEAGEAMAGAMTAGTMTAGTMTAGTMTAGTMTAGTMTAGTMTAGTMTAGTMMTGGEVTGGEMTAGTMTAGTMTGGSMTGGTMMTAVCNEVVEVGAVCDPDNDCCARGSFCNGESGGEGQCVRRCEIDADGNDVGCEARELCVEAGDEGDDGITPGFCLPGDDCEPGNENLACGEGEFHCFRARNISLCIGDLAEVRAQAPELIVGEGEACNPFGDEANMIDPTFCEQGYTCESNGTERVCRKACDADADCAEGQICLDYIEAADGLNYKFCSPTCQLDNPDCGETGACVLTDINNGVAFGTCQEVAPAQLVGEGERCDPYAEDTAPVFCTSGLSCEFDGVGYICRNVCSADADCAEGETCFSAAERFDNDAFQYSFCTVPCDPLDQDCAAETDVCVFSGVIGGQPAGTCVADVTSGSAANGEACTAGEEGYDYWGTCAANNVCFIDDEMTGAGTCGSFCAEGRSDLCTGEYQACTASSIDGLGLCNGQCDIFTDDGCDEGESCLWGNEGPNASGTPTPTGFCEENPNADQVGTEEVCVMGTLEFSDGPFEYPFLNNCPPGHICIGVAQGQPPICLQTCNLAAETDEICPDGLTCQGLFQGIETVGICFQ